MASKRKLTRTQKNMLDSRRARLLRVLKGQAKSGDSVSFAKAFAKRKDKRIDAGGARIKLADGKTYVAKRVTWNIPKGDAFESYMEFNQRILKTFKGKGWKVWVESESPAGIKGSTIGDRGDAIAQVASDYTGSYGNQRITSIRVMGIKQVKKPSAKQANKRLHKEDRVAKKTHTKKVKR